MPARQIGLSILVVVGLLPGVVVAQNGRVAYRFGPASLAQAAPPDPVYTPGAGVTYPTVIRRVDPPYTAAAMRQKVEGTVVLEAVVQTDGTIADVKVVKSLDTTYGLDQAAIEAVKKWVFQPGTRDGVPVRVRVTVETSFRISARSGSSPAERPDGQVAPAGGSPAVPISDEEFMKGAHKPTEAGVVSPKVKDSVEASYTPAAMQARIQGTVRIEMVVAEDGTVARARIAESLDKTFGLDESALAAALKSKFEPGTLNGQPVPVVVSMTKRFRNR